MKTVFFCVGFGMCMLRMAPEAATSKQAMASALRERAKPESGCLSGTAKEKAEPESAIDGTHVPACSFKGYDSVLRERL